MTRRVVVTGLGLVTPVGNSVEATWAALMSGQTGVDYIKKFDTEKFSVKFAAEVKDFDPLKFIAKRGAKMAPLFISHRRFIEAMVAQVCADRGREVSRELAEQAVPTSAVASDFWAIEREHSKC